MRPSGRAPDELRSVTIETNVTRHAEGSCLIRAGDTHVLITASIDAKSAALDAELGSGLGHGRIRHAAAGDEHAKPARGQERPDRPDAGDPAPDRPRTQGRDRPRGDGRASDHCRLRRVAGRRRYADSRDHRGGGSRCGWPGKNWSRPRSAWRTRSARTSPPSPAVCTTVRSCWTWTMPRIPKPGRTRTLS